MVDKKETKDANECYKWEDVYKRLKDAYFKYRVLITSIIIPVLVALLATIPSCYQASEANKTARSISSITNRPYILFEHVRFSSVGKQIVQDKLKIHIDSEFSIYNNGTLPAWIIDYDIYIKGKERVIRALFSPEDKPTQDFTIGKDKTEGRRLWFTLMQGVNEPNGDVIEFENAKYKLALIATKYRAIGDLGNNNIFTYWEMFRFDAKYGRTVKIQCGTGAINNETVKALFEEQEKRFIKGIQDYGSDTPDTNSTILAQ